MDNQQIYSEALEAYLEAYKGCVPNPMTVGTDVISDGMCGFGHINVKGNTAFGRWLKKEMDAERDNYHGGVSLYFPHPTQSYDRVRAGVLAAASVLRNHGIKAIPFSSLD